MQSLDRIKAQDLGYEIEFLIKEYFESKGLEFYLSEDKYDDKKDGILICNGKNLTVEIKLQSLYRITKSFTIPITGDGGKIYYNQLEKCKKVDVLIFCQRPTIYDRVLRIYCAPSKEKRKFKIRKNKKDRRDVAHIKVSDMTLLKEIQTEETVNKYII